MGNDEIIAKLYSLRAGISLIAKEEDTLTSELASAEAKKALDIMQARTEALGKISADEENVRCAEEDTKRKETIINENKTSRVQDIKDEIEAQESRINNMHSEAADSAELTIADRKPAEERNKYDSLRQKFNANKEIIKKDYRFREYGKPDLAKLVFSAIFIVLHILIAIYEVWSINTLEFTSGWFWLAFFVTIGIMVIICIWSHDEWENTYVAFLGYTGYLANIGCLLATAVISFASGDVPDPVAKPYEYNRFVESLNWEALIIAVCVTCGIAFIITLWRTIRNCKEGLAGAYLGEISSKRKARRENRKMEKDIKKADELENTWREYEKLRAKVRAAAVEENKSNETVNAINDKNQDSLSKAREIEYEAEDKIADLYTALRKRKEQHEELKLDAENQCKEKCEQIEAEYEQNCAALKKYHTEVGMQIWQQLVATYGKLLDSRDWNILDLVIWQLETGRADTIKEALQLADRETQAERLEKAIQSASNSIANQIGLGFGDVQQQLSDNMRVLSNGLLTVVRQISAGFSNLSYEIGYNTRQISHSIGQSAEMFAEISERKSARLLEANRNIQEMVSQSSLQTALLEKANSSSNDLIAAVDKLRSSYNK